MGLAILPSTWLARKFGWGITEITSAPDVEDNKRIMENTYASDVEYIEKIQEIIEKVQLAVEKLEKSSFFRDFMQQMRNPELVAQIRKVIGRDPEYQQLQLVLYGVGGLERVPIFPRVEICHAHLAFAILLRDKFEWVSDIVVYDPSVPPVQQKVINAFNCTFMSVNELGKRTVKRPTIFFMPRCPIFLVDNVLSANWTATNLKKAILHSDNILHEMPLPKPETCEPSRSYPDGLHRPAFLGFSWHFFTLGGSIEDLNLQLFPEVIRSEYSSMESALLT